MLSLMSRPSTPARAAMPPLLLLLLVVALVAAACGGDDETEDGPITVYSGRAEELVGPLFAQFEEDTGIELRIRYGGTSELAAVILEEGDRSPADVYLAQDAGALGAMEAAGVFQTLPDELLDRVDAGARSRTGAWVGVSGRARVLVYSTERVSEAELPASVFDLTQPAWRGRVGS